MNIFQRLVEALSENMSSAELQQLSSLDNDEFEQAIQIALETVAPDHEKDDIALAAWYDSLHA